MVDGGLEDDNLSGGAGNDVLIGGQGDDQIDGGDGVDVAQYSGSYGDYRVTKIKDAANGAGPTFRVVDTRTGRDGADTITNVEKLSFSDVSRVDLAIGSPLPVKDILGVNSTGQALARTTAHLLSKNQLLSNDRDWDSDTSQLSITAVLEAKGGTAVLTVNGDVLFTPDATYTGVMTFKYKVQDAQGNFTQATNTATGQTEAMKAAVYLQTADLPTDPLAVEQWYLMNTNVIAAWGTAAEQAAGQGYSGKGVKIAQFEPGAPFSTGPEVFDYRHPDLQQNADKAWLNTLDANGNSTVAQTFSNHATMVAGVMVAARNGQGGVGVAYNASLAGQYIQGTGLEVAQLSQEITDALAKFKNYDVVNNSWGATANFYINVTPVGILEAGISDAVANGRNGLGTAIVMAGGNDRAIGADTNTNALTANRAVITTGSINAPGDLGTLQIGSKPFSNPGASILVSAPGSNIDSTSRELIADNGSTFGGDYGAAQGTSFAAPIVSGIIALMLETNPKLGYRDIQSILAMSATQVADPNGTDWVYNTAKNWNGGGMHASHDYGFGKVDARAAVRLAETWYDTSTANNEQSRTANSGAINAAIPDGSSMLARTLTMTGGLDVESAQVTLDLTHQRWGDLIVKLISPTGTESILVNRPGKVPGSAAADLGDASSGLLSFSFNTTHVRGEASVGNWTLQVIDAAGGHVGTLNNWKLDLYGATADSDDVYVYTNEFATTAGRTTLADGNGGGDIINASAVTGNSMINLNNGSASTIAGKTLVISGDVEKAYGGDGNDSLTGNALTNVLLGGRGNDTLSGGAGADRLQGGRGNDTMTGGTERDWFVIQKDAGSVDTITDFNPAEAGEKIALVGFGNIVDFSQLAVVQEGSNTRLNLGGGQSVMLSNLAPSQISEQNCVFSTDDASLDIYLTYAVKPMFYGTAGVDNALIPNTSGDLSMFALGGDDVLGSQTASDLIDGGDGNDTLWGDYPGSAPVPGADWLEGGAGNDVLRGGAGGDRIVGGSGNDAIYGEDGDDFLLGNTGADLLDGGAGNDVIALEGDTGTVNGTDFAYYGTRVGGAGADTFKVLATGGGNSGFSASNGQVSAPNLIADFDPNQAGEKIDVSAFTWIRSIADLAISNWTISGTQVARISVGNGAQSLNLNIRGVTSSQLNASHFVFATPTTGEVRGTAAADVLVGDAGANTIDGLAGADSMTGRTGDDTYVVDNAGDTINELPGGGYDSVQSSVSYSLSSEVEVLTLTGNANLNANGNAQRNRLVGNAGVNRLDGDMEADDMLGGAGNDTYVVDNQLDTAFENANEGTDTVESSVSWTLGGNFENLSLTGTGNVNGTGNEAANALTGNAADNVLDGAQGADTMAGGLGNDNYYVDNTADIVTEALDAGIDTIYTSIDQLALAANVENAVLFGSATTLNGNGLDNTLIGNALANTLVGAGGNDVLDGGAGADSMAGGAGDDTYFVDNFGDVVTELASEGVDTVVSSISLSLATLGAQLENLVLTGTANLSGTGNALANQISGSAGNDVLVGGAGNDTLAGNAGNDTLTGGAGYDTAVFGGAKSSYTVTVGAGNATVSGADGIDVLASVEKLSFSDGSRFIRWPESDFDGDGMGDILWRNSLMGQNAIWLSGNSAAVQWLTTVADMNWQIVGTGDFDGDSKSDILWRNNSFGLNVIWRSGNSANTQSVISVGDLTWKVAGAGDFNGDGVADILWRNASTGSNVIWKNGNSATTQSMTSVGDLTLKVAGIGDFNGDGVSDILWRNSVSGINTIWQSANSATTQSVTSVGDLTWSVAGVADFNGDGTSDIFWRNTVSGANVIWKGGNSAATQAVTSVALTWQISGTADYNGDGWSDLLWRNTGSGADVIWYSANSTPAQTITTVDLSWSIPAQTNIWPDTSASFNKDRDFDFNGDGMSDVMWRNTSIGANAIWLGANNVNQQGIVTVADQTWKMAGIADFNGDGKDDVLWRNASTGSNAIWNSGNNTTQSPIINVADLNWKIAGLGDFNGDGKDDVLWRNATTGDDAIWNGGNSSSQVTITNVADLNWKVAGIGDFNGDGKDDVFWRNFSTGDGTIWLGASQLTQQATATVTDQSWQVVGVGDFNGDGKDDLLWRNFSTGGNAIWHSGSHVAQPIVETLADQAWKVVGTGDYNGDGKADLAWRNSTTGADAIWNGGGSTTQLTLIGVSDPNWMLPAQTSTWVNSAGAYAV